MGFHEILVLPGEKKACHYSGNKEKGITARKEAIKLQMRYWKITSQTTVLLSQDTYEK
jgi:hypothetical protein